MASSITNTPEEKEFRRYVEALLSSGDESAVFDRLAELELPRPYRARVKVLYSTEFPSQIFKGLVGGAQLKPLGSDDCSFQVELWVGRKENRRKVQVPFSIVSFQDLKDRRVQALLSVCTTDQWKVVQRYVRNQYPHLVPVLLSQAELICAAKSLRDSSGHALKVRSLSAKEDVTSTQGRKRRSIREWTEEDLQAVLLQVEDRQQMLTSIDLDFFPRFDGHVHVVPKVSCKIRKEGEIEVTGSLRLAFDTVVEEVARVGLKKLRFFSRRGLREANYEPHPLAIKYRGDLFEDVTNVRSLVTLLAKYPHSMHAVQHGNPYAHVKLTDTSDFSSFEVWAVPPSRVVLLPGLKASEAAFERLVHYIFDGFREGAVANYERGAGAAKPS